MLSTLPKTVAKKAKRLGRGAGSGKGAKSGRGTTRHQKAREKIPLAFEGGQVKFIKKFPLLRGKGRNKPRNENTFIITLTDLERFEDGTTVELETLIERNMIKPGNKVFEVKVLANGKLTKKLTIALPVSAAAQKMIEEAGGQVK